MDERVLRILEYNKILAMLEQRASSEMGRALCMELRPSAELADIEYWQQETEQSEALAYRLGGNPVPSFTDIRPALMRMNIGAALSPKELLLIGGVLRVSRNIRDAYGKVQEQIFADMANSLITLRDIEEDIFRSIIGDDEIADAASPALADIRRHIRACNERIREKLNSMIHSAAYQKYLQEPIVTIRNGRFVVPVKLEYRSSVPGLIHDQSASGATLFIEPVQAVEINNDLKQLEGDERKEIERILAALTARLSPDHDLIASNCRILAKLDFAFAKGLLACDMKATRPEVNNLGILNIKKGRHPLIPAEAVVPIDIWLGEDFTSLIITGPNTGGKTVTLKTVGLFALMAQSGLHIPAMPGSKMPVFGNVFADIGDEQSIEQSLSTFSSHMKNIVNIFAEVQGDSLVLLDELGAGTDPTEGAALAISILERLLGRGIRTVATTHYSELKEFALTRAGVENASVEFDIDSLRPTYRLSIGIPGKSNAFEISKRLGLDEGIIDDARQHIASDKLRFEDVLSNAEYHRQIAEKERQTAERLHREVQELRNQAEAEAKKIAESREASISRAKEEARRILSSARAQADHILSDFRKMQKMDTDKERDRMITRHREELKHSIDALTESRLPGAEVSSEPPKDLKKGETVRLLSIDKTGTVVSLPDNRGELTVQIGIMKMNVNLKGVRRDTKAPSAPKKEGRNISLRMDAVSAELDLRGKTLDDAMLETDSYLDRAVMAGLSEVSLVHGKGTGVLRNGLHEYLRNHPHAASYRLGEYGEGDTGVTIVKLR